jgi:glycine/D-amino acid oxidase-like deaminating enzyme
MKRQLDLRTGQPVWSAYRAPAVPRARLRRDIRTEVLVIGMGISGAMIAEALTQASHEVVCIDRRGPIQGSTAATTALVQYEIDRPLSQLTARTGRDKAERAWRRSRLGVANLNARISELGIKCDLSARQSLYLDGNVLSPSALKEEQQARNRAGLHCVHLPPTAVRERFGIADRSALLGYGNLALDPRKLASGLLRKALDRKARIYAPVEATGIEAGSGSVTVATKDGPLIVADHVVLATGYELLDMVPQSGHTVVSTYAIATRPQKRALWPGEALIWEASDPYLYMRATADGRVICGGEDEPFQDEDRRDELIAEKSRRIAAKLGKLFPQLDPTPEFAWAGAFGTTATGLPLIGKVPGHPRIFAIMGYGGNGITYSQIASEIVTTALSGTDDADADLFAIAR